jgi:hydrogenase nickel incorporation protein HypB
MCGTCGCDDPNGVQARDERHVVPIDVHERILSGNERQAGHNRHHFRESQVLAVNVMGSPGAGKTAVLEATAQALQGRRRIGALAGDLATDNDADRLKAAGIRARSITTGMACHLDAAMVHHALHHLAWNDLDYLFIENVGNLVCPAVYDLGQAANVVLLAVTEGEDKPLKYPVMFNKADLVLITKIDLLPHLPDISLPRIHDALERVMPVPRVFELSARTGQGLQQWLGWLHVQEQVVAEGPTGVGVSIS